MEAPSSRALPTRDKVPMTEHMNFLSDAAHLLRATAPETSAWLMSRSHELSLSEGLQQTDVQRQRACAACGLIMIPGMGSSVKMEADRTSPKRHGSGKKAGRRRNTKVTGLKKVLQCGHCMEKTVIKLEPPPSANRSRKLLRQQKTRAATETQAHEATGAVKTAGSGSASMASSKASTPTPTATTSSANASSKKRAKSRKAGLQALLDQNKNAKGSRSLSLADFSMKR
ncbi:hypothetical protein HYQ45_005346 [Verticillium longisporum]|uniref:Uncharacterized protein n=2 Tax=Verticillium TaxID=1036719 RepID=A0A8I2ZTB3_VERLO|nr:Pre-mRNA-splicing factor 38 [Verticillium dahliae VDG1]KAG7137278.1 hypothetical protein HYQ45_005346 [Verticillium longisporum]RBQ74994.1 hypothetical protein VDGD_02032 [Verticillium dahliae]RXG50362.1 hypothetical protein VDGE_02032 [Verticillium dahliae]